MLLVLPLNKEKINYIYAYKKSLELQKSRVLYAVVQLPKVFNWISEPSSA